MRLKSFLLSCSLSLNIITWLMAWFMFPRQSPTAILHYSNDIGIDFVGTGNDIMTLPFIGSLMIILNYSVGLGLKRMDERLMWILISPVPLMQLTLLGAFITLWYVNH